MPRQDGTGPQGAGPMTGRGFGPCGGGMRRGFGGFGRCCGFRRSVTLTKEDERKVLEAEIKEIDQEKQEIEKRLKELK